MKTSLILAALIACALPAFADETPRDPRVEALLMELPSDAERDKAIDEMPDLNRLVTGMLDILKDDATQARMKAVGERMAKTIDGKGYAAADGELPDLNAMMRDMMSLMSDRELIADMAELGFELEDEMKALAEENGATAP